MSEVQISIGTGFARTPAHKGYENTSDRDLAPHPQKLAPFQTIPDADPDPARLAPKTRFGEAA